MSKLSLDSNDPDAPLRSSDQHKRKNLTLDIAGAAIFGALSISLSLMITTTLPRVWGGNGPAFFDPVSLIWICAFLVFGVRCGLLTALIGTLGLLINDPTAFMVGPFMKFVATIWFIVIPYVFIRIKTKHKPTGEDMKNLKNYIPSMIVAWIIRCVVMVALNYVYLFVFWGGPDALAFTSLDWLGIESIAGHVGYIVTLILINTIQTIGDAIIPYILIFSSKIYDRFTIY